MKPGYKQTEVGVIPEDWEVRKIESLCGTITTGKLDANAMRPDGPYRFYTCAKDYYQIDQFAFDCEALLISGNGAHVGYIHYYQGKFNAYQRTYVLFGFKEDIKFIQHYLYENFKKRIEVEVKAGGTPYITRPTIAETDLPIPPLPEQRAIAEALSDVDGLLGGLDRLIAKKRDLKQAAMQQLLTGQTRLPGFHGEWEVKRLGDIADFANGKPHEGHIDAAGQFYLVTLDSIGIDGKLKAEHKPIGVLDDSLQKDDIVTILSDIAHGNLLGLCDVIPENNRYVLNQRVGRLRVKPDTQTNTQFLRLQINRRQHHFKTRGQGTSQRHVYRRDFDQLELSLPTPAEQTAIAEILSDMDAELTALLQRREKVRALKQAMMQELLTGRTRLV